MVRIFIDANVIVAYITYDGLLKTEWKGKEIEILNNNIKEAGLVNKGAYSFILIETLKKNKHINNLEFVTSSLTVSEASHAMKGNYQMAEMVRKGIPPKYFFKLGQKNPLPGDLKDLIKIDITRFCTFFISKKIIKLTEKSILKTTLDFLITRNCDSHDALLLSQAHSSVCSLFLTQDDRLGFKEYKKMKIVGPQEVYERIKSLAKTDNKIKLPFKSL